MSTIHDVARVAGVGVGTVSRHLNGTAVRPATAARIERAIGQLGFVANRAARGLARGRLPTIAVLIPYVTQPSAVERVRGVLDAARGTGLPVSLYDVERPEHLTAHLHALCGDLRPEGLLVVSLTLGPTQVAALDAAEVRTVFLDAQQPGHANLVVDDVAGGRLATEHLISLGHTRIAFLGDREDSALRFTSSALRRRGYREAMASAGLSVGPGNESLGEHGAEPAAEQARALLGRADPPSAVVAASDTQALGVLRAAREAGVRVPVECSVLGFDDIEAAASSGLSTVRQPLAEMSARAVDLLTGAAARTGCDDQGSTEVFDLTVVQRGTTGPPADPARG
ncbi:MAG TPA: LacI family DNA-binding transcriptional regulator [Cellulomonas sp.]